MVISSNRCNNDNTNTLASLLQPSEPPAPAQGEPIFIETNDTKSLYLVKEALRLGFVIESVENTENTTAKTAENVPVSYGLSILCVNSHKAKKPHKPWRVTTDELNKIVRFNEYCENLENQRIIVENIDDNSCGKVLKPADRSRYFPKGRFIMHAKVYKRLGRWYNCPALMNTLTFNPALYTREEAWRECGRLKSEFLRRLNIWRQRHGLKKAKCISVLECQPDTGYPHFHIVFPYLGYLAPISFLNETWCQGNNAVDIKVKDSISPISYVCKYISKLEGWDELALAYIWENTTRIYSMSQDYYLPDYSEKRVPEWQFHACMTREDVARKIGLNLFHFHKVSGVEDLQAEADIIRSRWLNN
jgi:hypothetical protein